MRRLLVDSISDKKNTNINIKSNKPNTKLANNETDTLDITLDSVNYGTSINSNYNNELSINSMTNV